MDPQCHSHATSEYEAIFYTNVDVKCMIHARMTPAAYHDHNDCGGQIMAWLGRLRGKKRTLREILICRNLERAIIVEFSTSSRASRARHLPT